MAMVRVEKRMKWWEGERGWVWERRWWPQVDKRVVNFINDYIHCFYFHNMVRRKRENVGENNFLIEIWHL